MTTKLIEAVEDSWGAAGTDLLLQTFADAFRQDDPTAIDQTVALAHGLINLRAALDAPIGSATGSTPCASFAALPERDREAPGACS